MWVINDCEKSPYEMGYKVEEEKQFREATKKKEANMDKPRICEVFGVEVDEEFTIGENQYFIDKSGDMWCVTKNGEKLKCGTAICCAINHPERIIRKTRFTEQEVEFARLFNSACKNVVWIQRNDEKTLVWVVEHSNEEYRLPFRLFPSIHPGQSYTLDDIIGGAG